jgi:ubiquinone/menaquinone biosynthesis C-methylase UbiE
LIREAEARGLSPGVEFVTGDAHKLEYGDGEFDGASAYRVFMHLNDPNSALRELVRVTKSGGRIAIREPDWLTLVIDGTGGRVDQIIQDHIRRKIVRNPGIAHRLPNMFRDAGLEDLHISGSAFPMMSLDFAAKVLDLENKVGEAVAEGSLTKVEGQEWLNTLRGDGACFFAALTGFIVAGTKK